MTTTTKTKCETTSADIEYVYIQFIKDDKDRWALYLKPYGERGFCVYPDKTDIDYFFITLKKSIDNIDKVRRELAQKYYALAETKPEIKVDLFGSADKNIDLNRIDNLVVFKTKNEGILCTATIDGQKVQARNVTSKQWQWQWLADNKNACKKQLAARLFADVLA